MYSIHNRVDLEKLKNDARNKIVTPPSKIERETWKARLSLRYGRRFRTRYCKVGWRYWEPETKPIPNSTTSKKQVQAIKNISQNLSQNIQQSSNILNKNKHHSIKQGMQENDDITNRNSQVLTSLVNSNTGDSSIVKTVCNLLNTQTQFELEPVEGI